MQRAWTASWQNQVVNLNRQFLHDRCSNLVSCLGVGARRAAVVHITGSTHVREGYGFCFLQDRAESVAQVRVAEFS